MSLDLVIGHCPKCLGSDIEEINREQVQCLDCGFVFHSDEMVHGVDPDI